MNVNESKKHWHSLKSDKMQIDQPVHENKKIEIENSPDRVELPLSPPDPNNPDLIYPAG